MKNKNKESTPQSNPFLQNLMKLSFGAAQHMIKDFTLSRSVKKLDQNNERFDTIENVLIKCEMKINQLQNDIDRLRIQLFWSNAVIIVAVVLILFKLLI
ncbi:MAG: hypothetical protein WCX83_00145 [Candidatus Cloacimonas sp.]|nr:hypothetical protein [Candidatus Cloacimonadota bacterium]